MTDIRSLIVFGATGDLAARLLLPGLGSLLASDRGVPLQLIGTGRSEKTDEEWTGIVRDAFASVDAAGEHVDATLEGTRFLAGDPTESEHLRALLDAAEGTPILYFALPPTVVASIIEAFADIDLPEGTSIAVEKPFGTDADSAAQLNELVHSLVPEERVFRTDHFLARATVLNLLGLRFANRVFEPVWSAEHVERVEIVYDETLALEGRAQYYDGAGALVDMIQSHLLQVVGVVAMDAPAAVDAGPFRDGIAAVLEHTRVAGDDPVSASRRARYTAGTVDGDELPDYLDEDGVDPDNGTETLAELTVEIDTPRWRGVPFTLRSGKALGVARKEILLTFRTPERVPEGLQGEVRPDTLRIVLSPEEVQLSVNTNGGGDPFQLARTAIGATFEGPELTPYGEVLSGVVHGDPLLSIRGDVAERCWRIVAPVLEAWQRDEVPMDEYAAGSAGPEKW